MKKNCFDSHKSPHDYYLIQPDLVELELVPESRNLVHSREEFGETFAILRGYLGFCLFQRAVRDGPCNFRNLDPSPSILITLPFPRTPIYLPLVHNRHEVVASLDRNSRVEQYGSIKNGLILSLGAAVSQF